MEIYKDNKVYIICPARMTTGGPELLHPSGAARTDRITHGLSEYGVSTGL